MFTPITPNRRTPWLPLSFAFHTLLLAALLYHHPTLLKATQLPGDTTGHRLLLSYQPGASTPSTTPQRPAPVPDPLPRLHLPTPAPTPPSLLAPAPSTSASSTGGTDTLGAGDIKIASILAHPAPRPNLDPLPLGTRGDVVIDIVIDETGHITNSTLARGVGHGVDEAVLATVQQWTFQPATRNGIPVASEQELLFHYERLGHAT